MYKIAIGSSNGRDVDLKFGEIQSFLIYQIDGTNCELIEKRDIASNTINVKSSIESSCENKCESSGCSGNGHGCGEASEIFDKVAYISDCRSVVCKKIGFQAQKQFEKKAISVFDVECKVDEALEKISFYYSKIDAKKSLRIDN